MARAGRLLQWQTPARTQPISPPLRRDAALGGRAQGHWGWLVGIWAPLQCWGTTALEHVTVQVVTRVAVSTALLWAGELLMSLPATSMALLGRPHMEDRLRWAQERQYLGGPGFRNHCPMVQSWL